MDDSEYQLGWIDGSTNMIAGTVTFLCLSDMLKGASSSPHTMLIATLGSLIAGFHAVRWYRLSTYPAADQSHMGNLMDFPLFTVRGVIFTIVLYFLNHRGNNIVFGGVITKRLRILPVFVIFLGVAYTLYLAYYSVSLYLMGLCKSYYYQLDYCIPLASVYSKTLRSFYWIQLSLSLLIMFYDLTFFHFLIDAFIANYGKFGEPTFDPRSKRLSLQHIFVALVMILTTTVDLVHTIGYLMNQSAGFNFDISFFNVSIHFLVICRVHTNSEAIEAYNSQIGQSQSQQTNNFSRGIVSSIPMKRQVVNSSLLNKQQGI